MKIGSRGITSTRQYRNRFLHVIIYKISDMSVKFGKFPSSGSDYKFPWFPSVQITNIWKTFNSINQSINI